MIEIDLDGLRLFIAVVEARSFRLAAERLGVSRPAVSQRLRRLEDLIGVALVHRTTRSVRPTEAGQSLYDRVAPALGKIGTAVAALRDRDAAPSGRLRLAVSSIADQFLAGPMLAAFEDACPHVSLDLTVTDEEFDIVAAGYDAGVRLGEVIEQDMISVPVSGDQRQIVVAAPSYLDRHGIPDHPRDLVRHRCIGWRQSPDRAPYRWEFEDKGQPFDVAIDSQITTNDMGVMLRTACAGGGLTIGLEETFRSSLAEGRLVAVLESFCPPFPGFYLYFPDRRHHAPKLRAFIDHVRSKRW